MKKHLLTLGILLLPTVAMAATLDFDGSWAKNATASDPAPNAMYWMTRSTAVGGGGGGAGRAGGPKQLLTIKKEGSGLHITESGALDRDYRLDGNPHTVLTDTRIQKATITAKLQPDALTVDTVEPFGGMPGNATLNVRQVWTLSPDGKTLTITTTRNVAARKEQFKLVYDRTEAQPAAICSDGCVTPK